MHLSQCDQNMIASQAQGYNQKSDVIKKKSDNRVCKKHLKHKKKYLWCCCCQRACITTIIGFRQSLHHVFKIHILTMLSYVLLTISEPYPARYFIKTSKRWQISLFLFLTSTHCWSQKKIDPEELTKNCIRFNKHVHVISQIVAWE